MRKEEWEEYFKRVEERLRESNLSEKGKDEIRAYVRAKAYFDYEDTRHA